MVARGTKPVIVKNSTAKKAAATQRKVTVKKAAPKRPVKELKSESASEINLTAYVPDAKIARDYVPRKIHGVWDFDIAKEAAIHGENMLLMGDTGAGKTMFGEAIAARLGKMYYSIPCDVSIDPSAYFGRMVPNEDGGISWQDGPATQIARGVCGLGSACEDPKCPAGVLNVSEINFMPAKIAASLYPMLDHRRYIPLLAHKSEVVGLHARTLVICDMNPNYRGTMELNAAFLNRFAHKLPWDYNTEVEEQLLKLPTTRSVAAKLRALKGTEIVTPVSTNMLMELEAFASRETFGLEYAIANFVSAFATNERAAVKNIAELNTAEWEKELAWSNTKKKLAVEGKDTPDDDDLEEIDFDFEEGN